ncbi:MAG: Na+/H+ antiporter subunit D, partial [Holophagae bacterium]
MNGTVVVAPVVVPLIFAAGVMVAFRRPAVERALGAAGAAVVLAAGVALAVVVWRHGPQAVHIGGWPAPFAITLVAD